MDNTNESIENSIIETTWEDKDTDYVAQHEVYKKLLNLKGVDELKLSIN